MTPNNRIVAKYLARYAEPECAGLGIDGEWARAIVLPVRDEMPTWIAPWLDAAAQHDALVIVVLNEADHAGAEARARNEAVLRHVVRSGSVHALDARRLFIRGRADVVLVADVAAFAWARTDGVGRARKIGLDMALELWAQGRMASPWLQTSDADVVDPHALFMNSSAPLDAVALVQPFAHAWAQSGACRAVRNDLSGDGGIVRMGEDAHSSSLGRLTQIYELWLRH